MQYRNYELVVDSLFSYKNPYLINPENPIGENNYESMIEQLQKFNYNEIETPEEQNRLVIAKHDSEKSYITNDDNAGKIAFYGNQDLEWGGGNNYEDKTPASQRTKLVTAGIEAVNGGNWTPINNIQGKKDVGRFPTLLELLRLGAGKHRQTASTVDRLIQKSRCLYTEKVDTYK